LGAQPGDLRGISPLRKEVFVQKRSKKTKKAIRANPGLGIDQKISNGCRGGRRNTFVGLAPEKRPAKMGGEILVAKPGVEGLNRTQVGKGMIEKNKNLIKKHLNKPNRISSLQN
jgi:hypothetical protein